MASAATVPTRRRLPVLSCNANPQHMAPVLLQRDTDGLFVCAPCVPDSTWKMYPGAKERELHAYETAHKRAELARQNFGKEAAHA
jgi:hypothetical protein